MLLNKKKKKNIFKHWFYIPHNNKSLSGAPYQPGFKKLNIKTKAGKTFTHPLAINIQ